MFAAPGILPRPLRRYCSALVGVACTLAVLHSTTTAEAAPLSESEKTIKAAFIYNFAKFVSWPPSTYPSPSAPFTICIADDPPMAGILNDAVRGKQLAGRGISIVPLRDSREQLSSCHIVFIARHSSESRILTAAKGKPVLTVGEEKGFANRGGIINFTTANDRVQFEINIETARRSGLEISSRLLSLARIVKEAQP